MKILIISNYRGLHQSRPEAELFIALHDIGYDITIMTYSDAEYIPKFEEKGIKIIPYHPTKKWDRKGIKLIRNEIISGNYDVLHLYNNKAITNGVQAAKGTNVKVIIYRGASANMSWYNPLNYLKFFHPRIDKVICNSKEIRQLFLKSPFFGKNKAITILKGHNISWYSNITKHNIRAELKINSSDLIFVTVANNRRVKGIPILLKAMLSIPSDMKIQLIIIGEKMQTKEIQSIMSQSQSTDRVHFLGYRSDALNIVASCDVFILPSIGSEALTKSVIEAMSMGVPAIISDLPGNSPLVDDKLNGFIFTNEDSKALTATITDISSNPKQLSEISDQARLKINRDLNIEDTVRQYVNLLYERE